MIDNIFKKTKIEAVMTFPPILESIATTFYCLLPFYLSFYYGYKFKHGMSLHIYPILHEALNNIPGGEFLENKEEKIEDKLGEKEEQEKHKIQIKRYLYNLRLKPENIGYLPPFIEKFKVLPEVKKDLKGIYKPLFDAFYNLFSNTSKKQTKENDSLDNDLKLIFSRVNRIPKKILRIFVRSINHKLADPLGEYTTKSIELEETNKTIFGKKEPTNEQKEKLLEEQPKSYRKWKKQTNDVKSKAKEALDAEWIDKFDTDRLTVDQANPIFKRLNMATVDTAFKGLLSLGDGPGNPILYMTSNGEVLNKSVPSHGVIMNPTFYKGAFVKDKWPYYCYYLKDGHSGAKPRSDFTYIYLLSSLRENNGVKFLKLDQLTNNKNALLDSVRNKFDEDLSNKNKITKMFALICKIGDLTAARIGNKESELGKVKEGRNGEKIVIPPVLGITTLKGENLTINHDGSATFKYIGKDAINQEHTIVANEKAANYDTVMKVLGLLTSLKNITDDDEYLFTGKEKNSIDPKAINKYLTRVCWPGKFHLFRTYHANNIFRSYFKDIDLNKDYTDKEALDFFYEAVTAASKKLGNKPDTCLVHYIDIILTHKMFQKLGVNVPKKVENLLAKAQENLHKIDSDDEDYSNDD